MGVIVAYLMLSAFGVEPHKHLVGPYDAIAWRVDCPDGIPLYTEEPGVYYDTSRCTKSR